MRRNAVVVATMLAVLGVSAELHGDACPSQVLSERIEVSVASIKVGGKPVSGFHPAVSKLPAKLCLARAHNAIVLTTCDSQLGPTFAAFEP